MAKEKICGIYCIENLINHKKYIGSSINIYQRWSNHKSDLRGNRHHNNHLQDAWNKYGENNFKFSIIELCDEAEIKEREQYYLDTLYPFKQNGYNIEKYSNNTINNMNKEFYQSDKVHFTNKNSIKKDVVIQICELLCNTDMTLEDIAHTCNTNKNVVKKIYYKITFRNISDKYIFRKRPSRKEYIQNINDKIESHINEIIDDLSSGMNRELISKKYEVPISYLNKMVNNEIFIEETKNINIKRVDCRSKEVKQFDGSMNLIQEFSSVAECSRITGIPYASIHRVCRKIKKTTHGYYFCFA